MTAGLGFGAVAEAYERFRLGYDDELVDAVLSHADRPVASAVEVGAGTGKAIRLVAARGIQVTAVEPDPAMAAVLERTTAGLPVRIVVSTLEELPQAEPVDLLYAAAAWHWTDPATRWSRAATLLAPGGVLALFGRPGDLADAQLEATVSEVESRWLADGAAQPGAPWSVADLQEAEGFTAVAERRFPATVTWPVERYLERVGTASAYLALPEETRRAALGALRDALPARVVVDATIELVLARRT